MKSQQPAEHADLLRQRRLEVGLPGAEVPLRPAMSLLITGAGLGGGLVLISVGALFWLQGQERALQNRVAALVPVEQRVNKARQRLATMQKQTKALDADTRRIANQLVSVRSGSAFFSQLRQVTPEGIQLRSVTVQPAQLNLSGWAEGSVTTGAYERINGLVLNLEALPEIAAGGVLVEQASSEENGITEFSLRATIDATHRPSPERLRQLGAEGLARRHERLQREGIPL